MIDITCVLNDVRMRAYRPPSESGDIARMSWSHDEADVRNKALPLAVRYQAIRSCIAQLAVMARMPVGQVLAHYDERHRFFSNSARLTTAMDELRKDHKTLLERRPLWREASHSPRASSSASPRLLDTFDCPICSLPVRSRIRHELCAVIAYDRRPRGAGISQDSRTGRLIEGDNGSWDNIVRHCEEFDWTTSHSSCTSSTGRTWLSCYLAREAP